MGYLSGRVGDKARSYDEDDTINKARVEQTARNGYTRQVPRGGAVTREL